MTELPLAGRVALVTGASRRIGIGAAIARRLAGAGADLLLHAWARHDAEQPWGADADGPPELAAELRALGRRVELAEADFADPDAPAALVRAANDALGPVDILVANHARSTPWAPLAEITAAEIDAAYAVNTRATLLLVQAYAAQRDDARPGGRVVLFTSGQGDGPMPDELPYAASKGALAQVTASLAKTLAPRGVTVNCVNPGPTDTGWAGEELTRAALPRLPFGRWGEPDDAARLVLWLASDDGRWMTGQVLTSDGGYSLG
jgi:3-oxoacyl-[acyl-carrier protein] reductase